MSDSDPGKLLEGLGDLDWDSALEEWEKNTFVPEVARDADTNRIASPLDTGENAAEAPRPAAGTALPEDAGSLKDVSSDGTVIAPVPRELREAPTRPKAAALPDPAEPRSGPPAPSARRGGLSQLFAKGKQGALPMPRVPAPPRPAAPSEKTRVAPPALVRELTGEEQPGAPSVTRQVAAPAADEPDADDEGTAIAVERESEPEPTLVRGADEDLDDRPAPLADAPTVSIRNLDEADSETMIADRGRDWSADADTATRLPAEDDPPTIGRAPTSAPAAPPATQRERPPAPEGPTSFEAERPVSRWLDERAAEAFRLRAAWLEEEARALSDPTDQARALLAVSELAALVGDAERALALAAEARDLAPQLPLAWRQTRQLLPRDPDVLVEALDAEAARSPTPAARAHATLLAADVLRTSGGGELTVERWDSACKLDPADVRAPTARAALALAQENHTSRDLDLAENSELLPIAKAVATALRLRGVERPGAEVDELSVNDGLRRARTALEAQDVVSAAAALTELGKDPSLQAGALWLGSAFGATHIAGRRSAARAAKTLANGGEPAARRQLAARGIELGDPEMVTAALHEDAPFEADERAALLALAGQDATAALGALEDRPELRPLLDALATVSAAGEGDASAERARRVAGQPTARALTTVGRLLAQRAPAEALAEALAEIPAPRPASAAGVELHVALQTKRWSDVSEAVAALPAPDASPAAKHVAAAMVAERAGDTERAKAAWREAMAPAGAPEGALRAAAALDPDLDLAAELQRIADDLPDGPNAAVLRLEALARSPSLDEEARAALLERVHRGAPTLGIGAFLAERIGRRRGDLDDVLRWIHERRPYTSDPLEGALDAIREALLVADRDPALAGTRLEEAHHARPDDLALRELYERMASEAPPDRGAWRERRAEATSGPARALFFTEAALEHERGGEAEAALRAARRAAETGDEGLSRLVAERAEIDSGAVGAKIETLRVLAEDADDPVVRRETYMRIAELEAHGRKDVEAAAAAHQAILERDPRFKPSLRFLEQALVTAGRDDELLPVLERIAFALDGSAGGEVTAHAQLAARFKARTEGGWEVTGALARLAASQPEPSLWSLRALNAHARIQKDDEAQLKTTITLLERTQRPSERAALLLRASEAAARLEQVADARAFLEQAANEDPGDVVTWGFLAEVRERAGETRAAADACESLARTSVVPEHQLLAWYDAARIWLDEVRDPERGMSALEQCAEIDVTYGDVFQRLSALYASRQLDAELARLLEKRLERVEDADERVTLEVELARALVEMGELVKAKASLDSALAERPDHTTALAAMAELCGKEGDWQGAEQSYVRLARLLTTAEEQRRIYLELGQIYAVHLLNLSRAEVAYKEVLKRVPNDPAALERLVDVYKRQGDVARATETQQQLAAEATDPAVRLARLIELAQIYETTGRDPRKAEQALESARKEFPTSVAALRAMAEFYARQRQMPAMQILLDRAAGDARRSFAAGRFVTSLFEVLHAAYDLRGKKDAARVVAATLAAVEGQPSDLPGADARAMDPRLDELLAPDIVSPALRTLLAHAGDALDAVAPLDLHALKAAPLVPGSPIGAVVGAHATVLGLGALQILVSPDLGPVAIPLSSNPPTLLVGEALATAGNERARAFVVLRALKMILARSSALLRGKPEEVALLVSALFTAFNPSFVPQGVDSKRVVDLSRRLQPVLPRNLDATVGVIALEAAGMLGGHAAALGPAVANWANRVGLLAIGDPGAALDALAWSKRAEGAPKGSEERAAWIARTAEARELMTFSVTDAYAEARARVGLGG